MLNNIEKGDTVVIKDVEGITRTVTVLSVKTDYERPGSFIRFDYINPFEASPMRRTAYPKELMSIVRKSSIKTMDPKSPRPGDGTQQSPQKAIVIDGKVYVERNAQGTQAPPLNHSADTKQVHPAVTAPAQPVTERIKKVGPKAK